MLQSWNKLCFTGGYIEVCFHPWRFEELVLRGGG